MARSGGSESEVLLGNRQLLSLFVIVVILLAVFFTMGYVLGKHSGTAGGEAVASRESVSTPSPALPSGFAESSRKPVSASNTSVPVPATPDAAAPASASSPVAQLSTPAPVVAPPLTPTEPAAGQTFLQVHAGRRPEAEVIAEVLKKQGFSTRLAPGPTEGIVRVLVGPLRDTSAITNARGELEKAGFKPILRRY